MSVYIVVHCNINENVKYQWRRVVFFLGDAENFKIYFIFTTYETN